jgi:predicted DNA-binding protein with PD1-like motif
MRSVAQPGPPAPERIQWVEGRGRAFSFTLQAGLPLLEAARRGFAEAGFSGGVLSMREGALGPFAYVMPALSKTGANAAFYSDTFRPAGISRLKLGAMTLGERDGAPFFHCHGLWTESDGNLHGGHILPEESIVAEPFAVEAFGIDGAMFTAEPDPETNFKLFGPVARVGTDAETTSRAFALRLRPNQDFATALETFCRQHGILRARIPPSARISPTAEPSCRLRPNSRSRLAPSRPARMAHCTRRSMSRWSIISAVSPRVG